MNQIKEGKNTIVVMINLFLKEIIHMEKEMEKEKNIIMMN